MRYITAHPDIRLFEHVIKEESLTVTHLVLSAGEIMHEHLAPAETLVIPFKGRVKFCGEAGKDAAEIMPGTMVRLAAGEAHALEALEDSELMVVKMNLVGSN